MACVENPKVFATGKNAYAASRKAKFSWQAQKSHKGTEAALQPLLRSLRPTRPVASVGTKRAIACIQAFLFLVFFPLGITLYYYNRLFGPSLLVSSAVIAAWWVNFLMILFVLP